LRNRRRRNDFSTRPGSQEQECKGYKVIEINRETESHEKVMADLARTDQLKKIGYEPDHATCKLINSFEKELTDTKLVPTEGVVE